VWLAAAVPPWPGRHFSLRLRSEGGSEAFTGRPGVCLVRRGESISGGRSSKRAKTAAARRRRRRPPAAGRQTAKTSIAAERDLRRVGWWWWLAGGSEKSPWLAWPMESRKPGDAEMQSTYTWVRSRRLWRGPCKGPYCVVLP